MTPSERKAERLYDTNVRFVERVGVDSIDMADLSKIARQQDRLYLLFTRRATARFSRQRKARQK